MTIVVLGASGGTGRQLVQEAIARGRDVRALVRNPERAPFEPDPHVTLVRVDVHDAASIAAAIGPEDTVLSGLGLTSRKDAGTLSAGARAVIDAHPGQVIWLGAMGTGPSARAVGGLIRWLLRAGFGPEYGDKVTADTTILDSGGTVVHSGPLSDKPDDPSIALAPVSQLRRQFFPAGAPRASIARLMLDLADHPARRGDLLAVRPRH